MPETKRIKYGDKTLDLPAGMSLEDAKAQMARFFPELSEAKIETKKNGDTTTYVFSKQAGRKGAMTTCASCGKRCDSEMNFCHGCQKVICLRCVELGDHELATGAHRLLSPKVARAKRMAATKAAKK